MIMDMTYHIYVLIAITLSSVKAVRQLALNASCHSVVYEGRQSPLLMEFQRARFAFQNEMEICFVEVINNFQSRTKISMYPKHDTPSTRTCLLPGLPPPEVYTGPVSFDQIVYFINKNAKTYRLPNGEMDPIAEKYRLLEEKLFKIDDLNTSCKRIHANELTVDLFQSYVLRNEPLVIVGAAPTISNDSTWSTNQLLERIGSRQVHVKVSPNGNFEGCEPISWWEGDKTIPDFVYNNLESPDTVLVRPASANMPFSTFIQRLQESVPTPTSYYLEYLSMATYVPELLTDAPYYEWSSFLDLEVSNLWFGDGKSTGKLHFDAYENLMTMVAGQKEFVLFDPSDNTRFYEGHIREAQYELDDNGTFHRNKLMESTSMVNSPVDILEPDFDRYPLFLHANAMRCIVNEGDAIFVPSFWWHEVISSPSDNELRNVAVNYWYKPVYKKDFPCKRCRLRYNPDYKTLLEQEKSSYKHQEL